MMENENNEIYISELNKLKQSVRERGGKYSFMKVDTDGYCDTTDCPIVLATTIYTERPEWYYVDTIEVTDKGELRAYGITEQATVGCELEFDEMELAMTPEYIGNIIVAYRYAMVKENENK